MGWSDKFVTVTPDKRVRYSFIKRDDSDSLYVRFIDVDGKKVKRSTEESVKHRAVEAAHRIILEAYNAVAPASDTITWDVAKERLRTAMDADGKRERTIGGYASSASRVNSNRPGRPGMGRSLRRFTSAYTACF